MRAVCKRLEIVVVVKSDSSWGSFGRLWLIVEAQAKCSEKGMCGRLWCMGFGVCMSIVSGVPVWSESLLRVSTCCDSACSADKVGPVFSEMLWSLPRQYEASEQVNVFYW